MEDWHVVARSSDVGGSQVAAARLLGEDQVVWRRGGEVMVWRDLCVHRGTRLSLGRVTGLGLECGYHGWTYDETGPDGIVATDVETWSPNPDRSGEAKMAQWLLRVLRPLTAYIAMSVPGGGPERYTMYYAVTPVD